MHLEAHHMLPTLNPYTFMPTMTATGQGTVERNFHGGITGKVVSGQFHGYERLRFHFPPIIFDTYQLNAIPGWVMKIRQKSSYSRPYINIQNSDGWGFRIRIKSGYYGSLQAVFGQINREYKIEQSDADTMKSVREQIVYDSQVVYRDRFIPIATFDVALQTEIEATKQRLGDWRPGKPSMKNVVKMEKYLNSTPISDELEQKIASL